jgi:hypothetical protein
MGFEEMKQNLEGIRDYVGNVPKVIESNEIQQMKLQLHMIERMIRQMTKSGIQIPEGLLSDRKSLAENIGKAGGVPTQVTQLYQTMLEIIDQIGLKLGKRPGRELIQMERERRKQTTPKEILRKSIIDVLKQKGGSSQEGEILREIGESLKDEFTPADLVKRNEKRRQWEMNVLSERHRMIKEGLLAPESKKNRWILKK